LNLDFSTSINRNDDSSEIFDTTNQITDNIQRQNKNLVQLDYVLPLTENMRFEAGYRGDFTDVVTDFKVATF